MLISIYPSVCPPTYLSLYRTIFLSTYLPIYFLSRLFTCSFIRLFVYNLFLRPLFYLSTFLLTYISICLFFRSFRFPFFYLPLRLCIYLPVYFPFRLSIYRFTWPSNYLLIVWSRFLSAFISITSFENKFVYLNSYLFICASTQQGPTRQSRLWLY